MDASNSWWAVAFSGFGVAALGWVSNLIYRHFKKEKDTSSQTIVDSNIVGPVAGRDMHIGTVNIAPPSSIPSAVQEEYHERPTPQEMHDEICKVPMYSQEKIAAAFEGLKVKWTGVVHSVRELSNGIIDFTMKYDGHYVSMKVKIDDYPILKTVRGEGDELAIVIGTIDYVQTNGPVHLKDVKLVFSFPPRIRPPEPTQPDHSPAPHMQSAMITKTIVGSSTAKFDKPVVNFVVLQSVEDYVEKSGRFRTECASFKIPGRDSGGADTLYIPYCEKQRFDFGPVLNDFRGHGVFTPLEIGKPWGIPDFVVYRERFHDIHCPQPCRGYRDKRIAALEKPAPRVSKEEAVGLSLAGKWTRKEIVAAVVVPLVAVLLATLLAWLTPEGRLLLHLDKPQPEQQISSPIVSQTKPQAIPDADSVPTQPKTDSKVELKPTKPPNAPAETHGTRDKATAVVKPSSMVDWRDKHNWRKYLHTGMTRTDVRQIFGEPAKMSVFRDLETWDYGSGPNFGRITFSVESSTPDGSLYSWDEPD